MWDTRTFTPVERPAAFGNREFMTKEEAAERERLGLRNVVSGDEDEASSNLIEQDVRRYAASDRPDDGRPGYRIEGAEYNAFWSADPTAPKVSRTSQVVDPPDGRIPPLTHEALTTWGAGQGAERSRRPTTGRTRPSERCTQRSPGEMRAYAAAAQGDRAVAWERGDCHAVRGTFGSYP
jgi:hypothetical protein